MTGLWIVMGVGFVVFMVFGGALLGLTVTPAREQEAEAQPARLVSFQPVAFNEQAREATVEQIVLDIERHLRQEGEAAAAFARDPSLDALRLQ